MLAKLLLKITNFPSTLRIKFYPCYNKFIFRLKGIVIGKNANIMGYVNVARQGKVSIGDNFTLTSGGHINPISGNDEASWFIEKGAKLSIGNNVGMSSTRIWARDKISIGNHAQIGANVLLIDTDTHQQDHHLRRNPKDNFFIGLSLEEVWQKKNEAIKSAPIIIEDDVWIGAHCIILKGVTIGARTIIGAGSVVTKSIPTDCIAAGNPCRVIRHLQE